MLPERIAFVDVETSGISPITDRVIEIGIISVGKDDVREFTTLLNPEIPIPLIISKITGIEGSHLTESPKFADISSQVYEILSDSLFIAHNVDFDYQFLRNEFLRLDMPLDLPRLCTVKLSRALYPQYKKHSLDSLIDRFNFEVVNRHRALDDAKVLHTFYERLHSEFHPRVVSQILNNLVQNVRRPTSTRQVNLFANGI